MLATDEKLEIAREMGAQYHINYSTSDVASKIQKIRPGGVEVVYDGVGKTTFETSLSVVARKGSLISFGNASGAVEPLSILRLAPKCIKLARPQL